MRIQQPNSATIIFKASRKSAALGVGLMLAVLFVWEWLVCGRPTNIEVIENIQNIIELQTEAVFYILAVLPLPLVPFILWYMIVALFGHVITIDGLSRKITKNHRILATFDEVDQFTLEECGIESVKLTLVLKSGKEVRVGKVCHTTELDRANTEITHLLKNATPVAAATHEITPKDISIPLAILFYSIRASAVFFLLASVMMPVTTIFHLSHRLTFQGNLWLGSIFLFLIGFVLYRISRFLKHLRMLGPSVFLKSNKKQSDQ